MADEITISQVQADGDRDADTEFMTTLRNFVLEQPIDSNKPSQAMNQGALTRAKARLSVAAVNLSRAVSPMCSTFGTRTPLEKASNPDFQLVNHQKVN